ncbi:hypothetical protein [Serratia fonticola]|uniref:hypothetical protein n=1 Tax=Serratia fonticola TaxID=47917 RepID=UPI0021AD74A5|nr:hypothetical protein [Serratia fonticola]
MKIKGFARHFFNEWMRGSAYFYLIYTGGNYLSQKLNIDHIADLLIVLFGCFSVGFVFVFFKQKERDKNERN